MAEEKRRIRVAVVGAGMMGHHHLRIYDNLKGVDLVGLVERDQERALHAANQYGIEVFGGVEDLVGKVDAASIASPSITHGEIGVFLLGNGIHCLIEKPLAVTELQCLSLIETAKIAGVQLMVGHVERFNPAVRQLAAILAEGHQVHAVDVRRLSSASGRITDVDVVADLMVHDLDIVLSLVQRPIVELTAKAVSTSGRGGDYVTALLSFDGGVLGTVTASRITQNKVRELSVTTDLGLIQIDYSAQTLNIFRQGDTAVKRMPGDFGSYHLDIMMERALVRNSEPLVLELQHFVDCARSGEKPLVSGEDALEALRLVWRIQNSYSQV
ncbi:Gfo/Idh/MocA family oxidoreductase [Kiloniella sp.]|uniref:Gfo/Idh/MocA family oxidoreductase n=1 Tax=Kiloniella sp. TaxID=1938587 RepID=UPI003A8CC5C4